MTKFNFLAKRQADDPPQKSHASGKTHSIRHKNGDLVQVGAYGRAKAIKAFCSECLGWEGNATTDCTAPNCPLYPYRGKLLAAIVS